MTLVQEKLNSIAVFYKGSWEGVNAIIIILQLFINHHRNLPLNVKVKLSSYLTKCHAIKTYHVLNSEPRNKDLLGEWRYSSTHS